MCVLSVCSQCGHELFSSRSKFHHSTPWPAFSDNPQIQCIQASWSMGTHQGAQISVLMLWTFIFRELNWTLSGLLGKVWQWIGPWVLVWWTKHLRSSLTVMTTHRTAPFVSCSITTEKVDEQKCELILWAGNKVFWDKFFPWSTRTVMGQWPHCAATQKSNRASSCTGHPLVAMVCF